MVLDVSESERTIIPPELHLHRYPSAPAQPTRSQEACYAILPACLRIKFVKPVQFYYLSIFLSSCPVSALDILPAQFQSLPNFSSCPQFCRPPLSATLPTEWWGKRRFWTETITWGHRTWSLKKSVKLSNSTVSPGLLNMFFNTWWHLYYIDKRL